MAQGALTKVSILVLSTILANVPAFAADGILGATSTGSLNVAAEKPSSVMISNLDDVDFGSHSYLTARMRIVERFCVFSSSGSFSIQLSSNNASSSSFQMISGTNIMRYEVLAGGGPNAPTVAPGGQVSNIPTNRTTPNCGGVDNLRMGIRINRFDFNQSAVGSYSDTLVLSVFPE